MKKRLSVILSLVLMLSLASCGVAKNLGIYEPGNSSKEITRGLAIGSFEADEAAQMWIEGKISQTESNKKLIDTFGNSVNETKRVYLAYLDAGAEYDVALKLLLIECANDANGEPCTKAEADAAKKESRAAALFSSLEREMLNLDEHIINLRKILGRE